MKRSFLITLMISVSACAVAMMALEARNKSLAERLTDEQAAPAPTNPPESANPAPMVRTTPEERLDRAVEEIKRLTSIVPPGPGNRALMEQKEFRKTLPDLLRSVEGLSLDELLAVARALPNSSTRKFLVKLAAAQDHQRVLDDETLMAGLSETEVLQALARKDPAAALRNLPPMKPENRADNFGSLIANPALAARVQHATRLLGVDLKQGLAALQEVHEAKGTIPFTVMGSFGVPTVPENSIPGLIEAMGRPEYAKMRTDLIELTVTSTLLNKGVDQVVRHVDAMELTEQELDSTIRTLMKKDVMASEPGPMIDWMAEVRPGKVPDALITWANQDLDGATTWLSTQDPSPMRDKAIATFARKAAKLDPDSAAQWAGEIQDAKLREQTLKRVQRK
jgi:hypothetical protein